jgi:hypothetical protein
MDGLSNRATYICCFYTGSCKDRLAAAYNFLLTAACFDGLICSSDSILNLIFYSKFLYLVLSLSDILELIVLTCIR